MTDLLLVLGALLLVSPLVLVSPFVYMPAAGLVLLAAGVIRSAGEP